MQRSDYLEFRSKYVPASSKLIVVAESPPSSGKYFYNGHGNVTEPLFSALMRQIGEKPTSKEIGLRNFQNRGWLLVDATYEPVNEYSNTKRDKIILRDYPQLRDDLSHIDPSQTTPIVLLKANVCRLLDSRLKVDGFTVINRDQVIPFPSHGQQSKFHEKFTQVVGAIGS